MYTSTHIALSLHASTHFRLRAPDYTGTRTHLHLDRPRAPVRLEGGQNAQLGLKPPLPLLPQKIKLVKKLPISVTYLAEVPRAPVLVRVGQPASPEGHAIEDEREWNSSRSGQHPPGVLEVEFVPALDPARMTRPGRIYLRYYTVQEIVRANLQAVSKEVEHLIAVLPA